MKKMMILKEIKIFRKKLKKIKVVKLLPILKMIIIIKRLQKLLIKKLILSIINFKKSKTPI